LDSLGLVAAVTLMIIRLLFSLSPLSWGGKMLIFDKDFLINFLLPWFRYSA
jgi:hypothetical protein